MHTCVHVNAVCSVSCVGMVRRRLKLVIRHIPACINTTQFEAALEPWKAHITSTYYHQGKIRSHQRHACTQEEAESASCTHGIGMLDDASVDVLALLLLLCVALLRVCLVCYLITVAPVLGMCHSHRATSCSHSIQHLHRTHSLIQRAMKQYRYTNSGTLGATHEAEHAQTRSALDRCVLCCSCRLSLVPLFCCACWCSCVV